MSPTSEFREVIDRLLGVISDSLDRTSNITELNKLQYALNMVKQAESFLEEGQCDASWLRLVGALDFLRMTPSADRELHSIRKQVDGLLDG